MSLQRSLGTLALLFYGVGAMIGAGIYSVIGEAAGLAGRSLWLSFLLAALAALFAGLSYAELSSRYPQAGAEYLYLRKALPRGRAAAFSVGVLVTLANAATAATVAIAFGGYLERLLDLPAVLGAPLLLLACTAVNLAGLRESTWLMVTCTLVEIAGLLLIIVAGAGSGRMGAALATPPQAGTFAGAALIFFVYTGFEGLANLAQETRDPQRAMPRAILASLAITTTLYVLVALAAVALAEPRALAQSSAPLATAAEAASPRLAAALSWIALMSTLNTALITLIVGSRLLYGMAEHGDLPQALARTARGGRSPWVAVLAMFVAAAAVLPLGGMELVAGLSAFATLAVFTGVHAALILLRFRTARAKSFRVPLSVGRLPLLPLLGIFSCLALATQFEPPVYAAGAAAFALALGLHLLRRRHG